MTKEEAKKILLGAVSLLKISFEDHMCLRKAVEILATESHKPEVKTGE